MKTIILLWSLLFTGGAIAQCGGNTHLADIPYAKNSSYFPGQYTKQLDELIENTAEKSGYLLLEFQILEQKNDNDARKYNMWLANRRIDRIKEYLTQSSYPVPIISRILTASNEELRDVNISWCDVPSQSNDEKLAATAVEDIEINSSSISLNVETRPNEDDELFTGSR